MAKQDNNVYLFNGSHSQNCIVPFTKIDKREMGCKHIILENPYMEGIVAVICSICSFEH